MIALYNLLLVLLLPLWVPWMLWRAAKRRQKVNWAQRTGSYEITLRPGSTRLWVHAVSVGEILAAAPLLRALRKEVADAEIVLSVSTSSGHETAIGLPDGLADHVVYFPIDVPKFVLRALLKVRPHAVLVMESELWMNFLVMSRRIGVKTAVVSGRISDRAFPKMKSARPYYRTLFRYVDRVWTQTDRDRHRFAEVGAAHAETVGNTKFDQAGGEAAPDSAEIRVSLGIPLSAPVVVVGSTRGEAEEALVITALRQLRTPGVWVVHAPRHLETAPGLALAVKAAFGSVALRSLGQTGPYMVLDTYGELARVYAAADVAVVGGAFEDLGGQNILQPLALGKPVVHGPNMQNFRDVADLADRASASVVCADAHSLAYHLDELLGDHHLRETMGAAARDLVERQRGVSDRYAVLVRELLAEARQVAPSRD